MKVFFEPTDGTQKTVFEPKRRSPAQKLPGFADIGDQSLVFESSGWDRGGKRDIRIHQRTDHFNNLFDSDTSSAPDVDDLIRRDKGRVAHNRIEDSHEIFNIQVIENLGSLCHSDGGFVVQDGKDAVCHESLRGVIRSKQAKQAKRDDGDGERSSERFSKIRTCDLRCGIHSQRCNGGRFVDRGWMTSVFKATADIDKNLWRCVFQRLQERQRGQRVGRDDSPHRVLRARYASRSKMEHMGWAHITDNIPDRLRFSQINFNHLSSLFERALSQAPGELLIEKEN